MSMPKEPKDQLPSPRREAAEEMATMAYVVGFDELSSKRGIPFAFIDAITRETGQSTSIATTSAEAFKGVQLPEGISEFLQSTLDANAEMISVEYATQHVDDHYEPLIVFGARSGDSVGRYELYVPSGQVDVRIEHTRGRREPTNTVLDRFDLIHEMVSVTRQIPAEHIRLGPFA